MSEIESSLRKIEALSVARLLDAIPRAKAVFVVGAGRMGIVLASFCMRLNHLGLRAYVVGSVTCPPITDNDLLLVVSSSGETATVREIVLTAHGVNAEIAAITAVPNSTIGKLSSFAVCFDAPASLESGASDAARSKQPMKTLFEQTLFIFLESVVVLLMDRTNQKASDMARRHANLE